MKKVFALLFVAGVMAFAACSKKTEEAAATEAPAVDTTATISVDSSAAVADSAAAPADSAK